MANLISSLRVLLVFITVYLLYMNTVTGFIWAFVLTSIAFILDGVDGYVARKLHEESKLGSVIDIIGDRIVENTYWVAFAVFGWIPMAFPIIALTRSFITDGLRSIAMEQGFTAFGKESMQESPLGYFVCSSRFSRITYAVVKAIAFIFMILAFIPIKKYSIFQLNSLNIGYVASVFAIELCVIRALPVIFESKRFFVKEEKQENA